MLKQFEVQNIYIGEYVPLYRWEYIEYKMYADWNGRLYVPTWWYNNSSSAGASYNRKISVNGWSETTYSWTSSFNSKITLSWYTAGTYYTIKIKPTTESYGWARAYSWYSWSWSAMVWASNIREVIYDSSYMWYATSATNTGNYFRWAQYWQCSNLRKPPQEYLPDTVTTIGIAFRSSQFYMCTSLPYAEEESLPSSITSIDVSFRASQYQNCTSLNEIKWWIDLSTIGSPTSYRDQQFYECNTNKTVKVLSDVWTSSSGSYTLIDSYVTSVSVPNAYLSNFINASTKPRSRIDDSKFIWY